MFPRVPYSHQVNLKVISPPNRTEKAGNTDSSPLIWLSSPLRNIYRKVILPASYKIQS